MRKKLLRSALLISLFGSAAPGALAEQFDFDPILYPDTRGIPDPGKVKLKYGDPADYGTKLRVYREHDRAEREADRAVRQERRATERAQMRAMGVESSRVLRARKQLREAQKDFDRAVAFGDRETIRYKRQHLTRARKALRRALSRH